MVSEKESREHYKKEGKPRLGKGKEMPANYPTQTKVSEKRGEQSPMLKKGGACPRRFERNPLKDRGGGEKFDHRGRTGGSPERFY